LIGFIKSSRIMKAYDRMFYWLFGAYKNRKSSMGMAEDWLCTLIGFVGMVLLTTINYATIEFSIEEFLGIVIDHNLGIWGLRIVVIMNVLMVFPRRYKIVKDRFKYEDDKTRRRRSWLCRIYCIASYVLFTIVCLWD